MTEGTHSAEIRGVIVPAIAHTHDVVRLGGDVGAAGQSQPALRVAPRALWPHIFSAALALSHLVNTRFRSDALQIIAFGRYARTVTPAELTGLEGV